MGRKIGRSEVPKGVRCVSEELTSQEVARLLGISARSVLYAAERGDLPGHSQWQGKKRYWRFAKTDVEEYKRKLGEQPRGTSKG